MISFPDILKRRPLAALLAVLFLSLLLPERVGAQNDPIYTQYWALPTIYNPARTGETDFLCIRGAARLQWVGIHNAPKSFVAAGDIPFLIGKKRIGAGVVMSQESLGLFSTLLASVQGSYKLKFLKGQLGIGLQAGYYNSKFRGSEVYIPETDDYHQSNDPAIPTQDLSGNAFDLSLGVSYVRPAFYLSLSAMHVTSPKVTMDLEGTEQTESRQYETELPRVLYFEGGGNIDLRNTLFTLQPSLLAATDFNNFSAVVSMRATYNKFITFGLGYRWNDALSLTIGAEYKNFFLGYAFDYPLSALSKASAGSHELVAGYRLKLDLSGKNKNKHRSIRIM